MQGKCSVVGCDKPRARFGMVGRPVQDDDKYLVAACEEHAQSGEFFPIEPRCTPEQEQKKEPDHD